MFVFSFVSCRSFLYLIGSLLVASCFGLIKFIVKGGAKFR